MWVVSVDYISEIRKRLLYYTDGRREFISDDIIESHLNFAETFIMNNLVAPADEIPQDAIDNAIVDLAVYRLLIALVTRHPNLKAAYDRVINTYKSILKASLVGIIPDALITEILEDQAKPQTLKVTVPVPYGTVCHSIITRTYMWKYWRFL